MSGLVIVGRFVTSKLGVLVILGALTGLSLLGSVSVAAAQSTSTYSGVTMWGIVPGGVAVNGAYESSLGHNQDGQIAGQVNAAKVGGLVGLQGTSLSIEAVGSQTIVSNTVEGQNITSSINATQTSTNSGSVSNTGIINSSP